MWYSWWISRTWHELILGHQFWDTWIKILAEICGGALLKGFDENQQSKYWKAFNLKIRGLLEKTISLIRCCSICISRKILLNLQKCCRTNQKLHHHALFHFKFPIAQIASGELLWYRVSKKWVLPKWAFADFSTNIIGISSQLAAGFPNAQFGTNSVFLRHPV